MPEHDFDSIRPIAWRDARLVLLDQRLLPGEEVYLELDDPERVADAIRDMVVRGAPAIGITAAYGVVLAARRAWRDAGTGWRTAIAADLDRLLAARPTAVNLRWAIERLRGLFDAIDGDPEAVLAAEAGRIQAEDLAANRRMGELGAGLIEPGGSVITHCNAGALATGGWGTALGVIRSAYAAGRIDAVYADETRPWLQGARLTAWELLKDNIPVTLIVEGAAAHLMQQGGIRWAIVGSDRIAANGDVANKIGTLGLAVLARHFGVRFMVVAPTSTVDMHAADGTAIPIEERAGSEVSQCRGQVIAAPGAGTRNPAFDITPASLIDVIVTERGIVERPDAAGMAAMMAGG